MTAEALNQQKPSKDSSFFDNLMSMVQAAQDGDLTQIATLLEKNSELSRAKIERLGNLEFHHIGATPLHYAAWCGNIEAAQLLMDYGADIDVKDTSFNAPPIGWAGENGQEEMFRFLIGRGAKTTIGELAAYGTLKDVRERLQKDPDLVNDGTGENPQDWAPLWAAVFWRRKEIVEFLLRMGAEVNATTRDGQTPLHGSVQSGNMEIVELIINAGADVQAKRKDDRTALHIAAETGHGPIAELLISKDAEVDEVGNTGQTALHLAALKRSREVVEVLLAHGSDPTLADNKGTTPLECAGLEKDGMMEPDQQIVEMIIAAHNV